jgi:hypothetical protein
MVVVFVAPFPYRRPFHCYSIVHAHVVDHGSKELVCRLGFNHLMISQPNEYRMRGMLLSHGEFHRVVLEEREYR